MISMNDFTREPEALQEAMEVAFRTVMRSGHYILGTQVENFEKAWAAYCGVGFATGTGNGLDAIEIALRAAGIGAGDEVITSSVSAYATVLGIQRAGAIPVLADIHPGTGLLSTESVTRCLTSKTKAILLVHLYGQVRQMEYWKTFCAENRLLLIEDAAQAHGAKYRNRCAGSFGTTAAFSFYPTKNLGALGDGGAVTTHDPTCAMKAVQLRNYGQMRRYHHVVSGLNSRLDELQAALLSAKLPWLDSLTHKRKMIAARYRKEIHSDKFTFLLPPEEEDAHVYHLFVVNCNNRDRFMTYLKSNGIESDIHYPAALHQQPASLQIRTDSEGLPNAEKYVTTCLSIPCHPFLTDDELDHIIECINKY